MSDYAKKTVAELQSILRSRGITPTGKKADLIARLEESDASTAKPATSEPVTENAPAAAAPPTSTEQHSTAADSANPVLEADQTSASADTTATATEPTEPQQSFAAHLSASNVDEELEKRKKRAARFNTGNEDAEGTTPDVNDEAEKTLARAKKFGTESDAMGKLDQALSTEREGGRGRKGKGASASTGEATAFDDPGLRRGFERRHGRGRGGRNNSADKPRGVQKPATHNDKDKLAAEARKKRFAAAS